MTREMKDFFGPHNSKISTGITCMIHAMLCMQWQCSTLTVLLYFTIGCHVMLREFIKNVDWFKLFRESLMEHFRKHVSQACFNYSCTVVTSGAMESSFNQ